MSMVIKKIIHRKKAFLNLLLLADEQENMIDRYLARGELFAAYKDRHVIGVCVITQEEPFLFEVKNLAIAPAYQKKGYGKEMLTFICRHYQGENRYLQVGTGAGTNTVHFYEKCGFTISHTVTNFFTDFYDHPIYEDGVLLQDMVYLKKSISSLSAF